ncbi:MAG: hypothetical protein OXI54_05555 [Chloroflexota bacterium]|nr:hypothetical protein [Chloroflexota bacterium]MDE2683598.1 hypothetical protein [Chloroflexota bacterium]
METIAVSQLYLLLAALGVGLTLIALVGRGLYVWGRMSRQVDDLGDRIDRLETKVDTLIAEMQQLNRMVAALANHRHDIDGNVVFNLPAD